MLPVVQLVNVRVVTETEEKAALPSNVVAVFAAPAVLVNVPLHWPSVACVVAVPIAVNVTVSPFAASALLAAFRGKDSVDATGPVGTAVPPPPPPPPQAVKSAARHSPVKD